MINIIEKATKILYPRRCAVCDELLTDKVKGIHPECAGVFDYVTDPRCFKCGKRLENSDKELCYDCTADPKSFERGVALYNYRSVEESVMSFKNGGKQEYSEYYADEIFEHLGDTLASFGAEAIIPIPLHISKFRSSGYNQSELLARRLSKHLTIPLRDDILLRTKSNEVQKKLSYSERQNNIKKAFHIAQNDVKLKTVILVDDVYTTGATINAATEVLKAHGVAKVYFVTLAIGNGKTGV